MRKGIILKVLETDGQTPKALHRWNRKITLDVQHDLLLGFSAHLHYVDDKGINRTTITSPVVHIEQNLNNIIITTSNSIYYIKLFGSACV